MRSSTRMVAFLAGVTGCGLLGVPGLSLVPGLSGVPGAGAVPARTATATSTTVVPPLGAGVPGGPPALLGAPSTTAGGRTRRTTTVPPPTTRTRQGLATPAAAVRNLWDGWRDDDRPRARLFATREAVDAVFARPWDPSMRDVGCVGEGDDGAGRPAQYRCTFRFLDGRAELVVDGDTERGYRVVAAALYRKETPTTAAAATSTSRPGKQGQPATKAKAKAKT